MTELHDLKKATDRLRSTERMPALFIGHGNPLNVLFDSPFTRSLATMGKSLRERPAAILVVSAHWLTEGTRVLTSAKPRTIYDFWGFPEELYRVNYPAPGAPGPAKETAAMVRSTRVFEDDHWGLDHGAWTVLKHMFPDASVPVYQLSIDRFLPPVSHVALAGELRKLRERGVLVIGSGNIVHNLSLIDFSPNARPFEWAVEFDELVKMKLLNNDYRSLIEYGSLGTAAALSIPTNDHYLPMLYTVGLAEKDDELRFTYEEIQNASVSMRSFILDRP